MNNLQYTIINKRKTRNKKKRGVTNTKENLIKKKI